MKAIKMEIAMGHEARDPHKVQVAHGKGIRCKYM